jgi:hypothetical protein
MIRILGQVGDEVKAVVIEGREQALAIIDKDTSGGDHGGFTGATHAANVGMGNDQNASGDLDRGLEGGEPGELTLENEWVTGDHRSRSRVSASMT